MAATQTLMELMLQRRTFYNLQGSSPISKAEIQEIISHTVLHVPSAFNLQSTRIVLLVGSEHESLWDIVKDVLREIVPGQAFATTEAKLQRFKDAYGTVSHARIQVLQHNYVRHFTTLYELTETGRYYFSKTTFRFTTTKIGPLYMPTSFHSGLQNHLVCTNMPFGLPLHLKA